jgi:hypothetical protein
MTDPVMSKPRYTLGVEGAPQVLRAAAESQAAVMAPFFVDTHWAHSPAYFEKVPALRPAVRRSSLGGLEAFGVVVGFIGTYFAKKIFDEVYDRAAKRPIGEMLDRILGKVSVPAGKAIEYRDVIYFEDVDVVVVVRALVDPASTRELQTQVIQAHRVAHAYIEQHGRKAPVHCHQIAEGRVSLVPELADSLADIKPLEVPPNLPRR